MSEIYIEGRFKMPVINTDELGYDEEEAKKIDWEEFAEEKFWNSCEYMADFEDMYGVTFNKVQPQLTLPKCVADELDGFNPNDGETKIAVLIEGYNECFISDELMQFCLVDNNLNLCALYLAGKALGVDLVKVVEG